MHSDTSVPTLDEPLLTQKQAAALLVLHPRTLRKLTAEGQVRAVRPTGRRAIRYRRSDIEALVERRAGGGDAC